MLEIDDEQIEALPADGLSFPLVRLSDEIPPSELSAGGRAYRYERSYPIKGYAAVMPGYLQEQAKAGKQALIVERPDRFYVYLAT